MTAPKLTTVIITLNEEERIGRCINSVLPFSDEVLVIDSFSTDNTVAICESKGVKVVQRAWEGYSATKNYANQLAKHDWILSIDADEEVSDALARAIQPALSTFDYPAYQILRLSNYCGKWIKHGAWYPEYRIRLFRKDVAFWDGAKVHEDVAFKEPVKPGTLKQSLYHYSMASIAEHKAKTEKYASLSAEYLLEQGKSPNVIKLYLSPLFKFFKDYFLKLGFLDGYYGFVIALENSRYTYLKYAKLKQLRS